MILAAVMAGAILGPIDASIVNVVLPTLASSFSASLAAVQRVPMAYLLASGSLVLPFGRLGDLRGHRKVFLSGLLAFVGASPILFVNRAQVEGLSARTAPLLVAATLCGALFVRLERRAAEPMVALSIFGNRRVALGASALPAAAGALVSAAACAFLATMPAGAGEGGVAWRLALFGVGTGLFQSPNNSAVMGSAPRPHLGVVGSLLGTSRTLGMVLGVAAAGAVLYAFVPASALRDGGLAPEPAAAFAAGVRRVYGAGAAFAVAAAFLASAGGGRRCATLSA